MSKNGSNCCMFEIKDGYLLSVEHDGIIAWREKTITEIRDETIVPMGIYQGGRDIPTGRYSVRLFPNTRWAYIRTFTDYQNFVDYQTNYSGELLFTGNLKDPNDECVFELADGEILYIESGDLYATPAGALVFN